MCRIPPVSIDLFSLFLQSAVMHRASAEYSHVEKHDAAEKCREPEIALFETQDELGQPPKVRPGLMNTDANSRVDLRPYGFTLHSIGYTDSAGEIQLTFSSPVEDKEKVYILVQPCNHNH